jgi:hypothetical protein
MIAGLNMLSKNNRLGGGGTQFSHAIALILVCEAIDQVRSLAIRRYRTLSTANLGEIDNNRTEATKAKIPKQIC